jgi:hypothetical protein
LLTKKANKPKSIELDLGEVSGGLPLEVKKYNPNNLENVIANSQKKSLQRLKIPA